MKRNRHIQLYRFIAALIIMLHHYNASYQLFGFQGYIIVELFFVISGFLMANKILNGAPAAQVSTEAAAKESWAYTRKKFWGLFPYSLTGSLAMFIGVCAVSNYQFRDTVQKFVDSFWEMSLLFMSGIGGTNHRYNGQAWFVSALLIVGYFVYYFFKKHPHFYSRIFAPASVLLIYAFFWNKYNHLCYAATFDTVINVELTLIRALAGLNLGIICYLVYDRYRSCKPGRAARAVISVSELALLAALIFMMFKFGYSSYDFIMVAIIAVITVLAFLDFGYGKKLYDNGFVDFLGKLSMPIYFNHVFIYSVVLRGSPLQGWLNILAYYSITIFISVCEYLLYEYIRRKFREHMKCKKEAAIEK